MFEGEGGLFLSDFRKWVMKDGISGFIWIADVRRFSWITECHHIIIFYLKWVFMHKWKVVVPILFFPFPFSSGGEHCCLLGPSTWLDLLITPGWGSCSCCAAHYTGNDGSGKVVVPILFFPFPFSSGGEHCCLLGPSTWLDLLIFPGWGSCSCCAAHYTGNDGSGKVVKLVYIT